MCKIAIIPKINPGKEAVALKLSHALAPFMTENDDDGFGYMALGNDGKAAALFGERWLNVAKAFKSQRIADDVELAALTPYSDAIRQQNGYNRYGTPTKRVYSIALHSRKATCDVSLANVHPFVNKDATVGIIHNGMISNSSALGVKAHGCDSESILTLADNYAVAENSETWQDIAKELRGWYAVASYSKDLAGNWWLDVLRDDSAQLHGVYVYELGGVVFCTSAEILVKALKKIKFKFGVPFSVKDSHVMRHDGVTGELVETLEFIPVKVTATNYGWQATDRIDLDYYGNKRKDWYPDGERDIPDETYEGFRNTSYKEAFESDIAGEGKDVYDHINMTALRQAGSK